jgi:hypothetical protein
MICYKNYDLQELNRISMIVYMIFKTPSRSDKIEYIEKWSVIIVEDNHCQFNSYLYIYALY